MWIFGVMFTALLLFFWKVASIWKGARANRNGANIDSSDNQSSPSDPTNFNHGIEGVTGIEEHHVVDPPTLMPPNPSHFNHEIEEVVDIEQHPIVDPPPPITSSGFTRTYTWPAWNYRICTIMAFLGGLVVGYLTTVTGGILGLPQYLVMISPDIYKRQEKSYEDDFCFYRNHLLLLHSSAINIMAILGIVTSFVFVGWGRRQVLNIAAIFLLCGISFMSWFPKVYVEVTGLLLVGGGVGLVYHVIPFIYNETIPKDIRLMAFDWAIPLGGIMALGMNYIAAHFHVWGWRLMFGVTGIPGIILLIVSSFIMLESPKYYIERNAINKAENAMKALRGLDVEVELSELIAEVQMNQSKNALRELLKPQNRPSLIITTMETIFGSFSSVDLLIYYGPFVLQSAGYEDYAAFSAPIILAVVQAVAKAVGGPLIRRVGRRMTYFLASVVSIVPVVCLGLFFHLNPNKQHYLNPHHAAISIVLVVIHAVGIGLLSGPQGWLEARFPDECSHIGSTYSLCLGLFLTFFANNVFLYLLCLLREWIFFLFAAWSICIVFFILMFVPDTTGIPQHAMVRRVWSKHWFWRRFSESSQAE